MKKIIVDRRFSDVARNFFGKKYEIVPSVAVSALPEPTRYHPDMALVLVEDIFVVEKTVYDYYKDLFPRERILCGETVLAGNYPLDIAYNVLISGKNVFAKEQQMDSVLKEILQKKQYRIVPIKQGYAACSSVSAGNCIITADATIAKVAEVSGLHVLQISPGDVVLQGYEYGFIGGASGYIDGVLYFFGDITKHRDFEKISFFLQKHQVPFDYIPGFPLTDVGRLIGI